VLLLDRRRRLVKTMHFGKRVYIGDPFNVIRIFNEKEVDEICVLDIDATVDCRDPDVGFLREIASECFMPLTYGGGISSTAQCEELMKSGVEKIVIGSAAARSSLVQEASADFGSQAVCACIDVRGSGSDGVVVTQQGRANEAQTPVSYARRVQDLGAGEILLQSVDRDGTRGGYDLNLINDVAHAVSIPLVAVGGAGSYAHLREGLLAGASAVASGSAFVFIGKLRGVLVSYPLGDELQEILSPAPGPRL
jgi:imidazole glycerol-phosphate synthase subunit HisF